ncbi:OLC1v1003450C1 [Oldenlandia corymbosa var. corymbosa]|uniref:Dirigent protein n=1 Tax=Oldenlandia corymbosa var. corymbosa TaxID=529605 RepID=A0AAV1DA28_OLDCO|nr:OLC1v1003450C1 [Oldenlandia corymbosa var. corymbosa]
MMKIRIALLLLCFCMVAMAMTSPLPDDDQSPEAVERWFRYVRPFAKPKLTKLKFYYHENRVAATPTAVEVARANLTATSRTGFGSTYVIDDPLTVSPDPNSQVIGRAQGIYASASQEDFAFILQFNVVFTAGEFKGSTLSVMARDPITNTYREPSIVGGSGAFRLARGVISTHTYSLDPATLNVVVEYNVFVEHY